MAEREIKTVLTLEDASFSKGLKAASSGVKAAQAEMNAAISSADGLGKGFKRSIAQVKGLSNVIKAQKTQMGVLSKEYANQKNKLGDLQKAMEKARQENGEGSKEATKAANAYAAQTAKVNDLRVKMADLETQMSRNKDALKTKLTAPLRAAGDLLKSFGKLAVGALAAGAAALVKFTADSNESKKTFNTALSESRGTFGAWSLFLEEEAKKAWSNLGLSQAAYLETAAQIGEALQNGGMGVQQSAEWVTQAMELAGQLSEKYGVPVETVLADIAKAAEGDKTALSNYGVEVQGVNDKMSASQAAAAILSQAMESVKNDADTLNAQVAQSVDNSGEKFNAAWENFKAGVGSSEDVAEAAAAAASSFATDFTSNLSTLIKLAPDTLKSFAASFSEGWANDVWPEIQGLFSEQFNVTLPDWADLKDRIQNGWQAYKDTVASWFGAVYNVVVPTYRTVAAALENTWHKVERKTADFFKTGYEVIIAPLQHVMQPLSDLWRDVFERTKDYFKANFGITIPSIGDMIKPLTDLWDGVQSWWAKNVTPLFIPVEGDFTNEGADITPGAAAKFKGHAGGLWNVPHNDYMARLHSGEMVLTAAQAARYRAQAAAGGSVNNYNDSSAIYIDKYYQRSETDAQALLNAMSVMQRRQRRGYGMA